MFIALKDFFKTESASSILLAITVVLAMVAANSPLASYYDMLHGGQVTLVINDGLMALFFLVIGIELKHEISHGELSTRGQAMLPVVAALGGVVLPAIIYSWFNAGQEGARGWAIPMATDIAFSLGVIGFFGRRLPPGLRVFLMALAVIDDLFAIVMIAVFYTSVISYAALTLAVGICGLLYWYNRKVVLMAPFLFAGAALWIAVHESGVHATIAGVAMGLLLPMEKGRVVLGYLHGWVALGVIPVFVFANAGVELAGIRVESFMHPVASGIALGLFVGKQLGIFGAAWLMVRLGYARLPAGVSWGQFYGVCLVAGIGFTMSLFIGTLAFGGSALMVETRLGVLLASLASAICGAILLAVTLPAKAPE